MKAITLHTLLFSFSVCYAQLPNFEYVKSIGSANDEYLNSLYVDSNEHIYLVGTFEGTIDFDPGPAVYNLTSSSSTTSDMYLAKLDSSGNLIWAKSWASGCNPLKIQLDNTGNILISGRLETDSCDMDPGPGSYQITNSGFYDIFILKLNASGNFIWAYSFGRCWKRSEYVC